MLMIATVAARTVFLSGRHLGGVCFCVAFVLNSSVPFRAFAAFWLRLVLAMLPVLVRPGVVGMAVRVRVLVCTVMWAVTGCFAGMVHTSADGDAAQILQNISTKRIYAIGADALKLCAK
jgi:hypothetical protein